MRRARDIPVAIINLRIAVAETFGAKRDSILRESNIRSEILADPKARITVKQAMDVWKAIVKQTGTDNIGLDCGIMARFQSMVYLRRCMNQSSQVKIHCSFALLKTPPIKALQSNN